jgi:hypothetical protein
MTRRTTVVIAVMLLLTATECTCALKRPVPTAGPTSPPQPTAPPTDLPTTPASEASDPTSSPPEPQPTAAPDAGHLGEKKQGGNLGDVWTLADVRVGFHTEQFRVVIEMREGRNYAPYFEAIQVDNAKVPFPTGHDATWGAARIDVVISDLYLYDFPVNERLPIVAPVNPVVTRVGRFPIESDAHVGFSIGLESPASYEVYVMTEPVRIIIDVSYP